MKNGLSYNRIGTMVNFYHMSDSPESFSSPLETQTKQDRGRGTYREILGGKAREILTSMHLFRRIVEPPKTRIAEEPKAYEPQPDDLPHLDTASDELKSLITEDPKRLAELLTKMKISRTDLSGNYFTLYTPILEDEPTNALAIKVVDTVYGHMFNDQASILNERTDDQELQTVLDSERVVFLGKNHPKVEESREFKFLLLALEHAKHEEFYSKYVLPADFIAYPAAHDVLGGTFDLDDFDEQTSFEQLKNLGKVTTDNREVFIKKGEIVYAMVQEYADMGPSVFSVSPTSFTAAQKVQLREFADTVQSVYERYGYFPDTSMIQTGSNNLRFHKDGRLLLIDTNGMKHSDDGRSPVQLLQRLRDIAQ